MEQWENEIFGHVVQPPAFRVDAEHRKQFEAAEAAVNAKLSQPPETHQHHEPRIAKPATETRRRAAELFNTSLQ